MSILEELKSKQDQLAAKYNIYLDADIYYEIEDYKTKDSDFIDASSVDSLHYQRPAQRRNSGVREKLCWLQKFIYELLEEQSELFIYSIAVERAIAKWNYEEAKKGNCEFSQVEVSKSNMQGINTAILIGEVKTEEEVLRWYSKRYEWDEQQYEEFKELKLANNNIRINYIYVWWYSIHPSGVSVHRSSSNGHKEWVLTSTPEEPDLDLFSRSLTRIPKEVINMEIKGRVSGGRHFTGTGTRARKEENIEEIIIKENTSEGIQVVCFIVFNLTWFILFLAAPVVTIVVVLLLICISKSRTALKKNERIKRINFKKEIKQVINQAIKIGKKAIQLGVKITKQIAKVAVKLTKQVIKLAKKVIKVSKEQVITLCTNIIKYLEN